MSWQYFPEVDDRMDEGFMQKLIAIRGEFNKPMEVTSSYRTVESEKSKGRTGNSAHVFGRAVDISARGTEALDIVLIAQKHGMTGFGISQKGKKRFIHIDDMPETAERPRPWIWSY